MSTVKPASSAAHQQHLDIIFIDGFVGETIIGIHHEELHTTQPIRIDLAAGLPRSLACDTDSIADTINYGDVRTALKEMLASHHYKLLEAFAEGVAKLLLEHFGAHWVRVRVTKPHKFEDVEGVGVMIERTRSVEPSRASENDEKHSNDTLRLIGTGMTPGTHR